MFKHKNHDIRRLVRKIDVWLSLRTKICFLTESLPCICIYVCACVHVNNDSSSVDGCGERVRAYNLSRSIWWMTRFRSYYMRHGNILVSTIHLRFDKWDFIPSPSHYNQFSQTFFLLSIKEDILIMENGEREGN